MFHCLKYHWEFSLSFYMIFLVNMKSYLLLYYFTLVDCHFEKTSLKRLFNDFIKAICVLRNFDIFYFLDFCR